MSDNTKKEMLDFVKLHKGELVLHYDKLVRLEGFYEDDHDYYYDITELGKSYGEGRKVYVSGCIGWMIVLKGVIDKKDYNALEVFFRRNVTERVE